MPMTVFERHPTASAVVDYALAGSRQSIFWLDGLERPRWPRLRGTVTADLAVVGGGYTGLWTAIRAKERDPGLRVVLLEGRRIGWAASGRNGGFCEASLTHGEENGRNRWPEEIERLTAIGLENLDGIEHTLAVAGIDAEFERTGALSVAVEEHQLPWIDEDADFLDRSAVRRQVNSPIYLGGLWERESTALVQPAKLAIGLARHAAELGVEIFEHSVARHVTGTDTVELLTADGVVQAPRVALATNVFPSLLRRHRLMTVPVYDYVLMTEPLDAAQWESVGWDGRQGVGDLANQFHYSRRTADGRILFGGYDAVYFAGGRLRAAHENRSASFRRLAGHFFTTFPQLEGLRFTHRWAGAIDSSTRFCAFFDTAKSGRVAYASGFTGLGVGASRFAADVMLDRLWGLSTEKTELRMVREKPLPFPPEPIASLGIQLMRRSLDLADHQEGRRNLFLKTMDALGMGFDS